MMHQRNEGSIEILLSDQLRCVMTARRIVSLNVHRPFDHGRTRLVPSQPKRSRQVLNIGSISGCFRNLRVSARERPQQ
jgi:hypothetical protein